MRQYLGFRAIVWSAGRVRRYQPSSPAPQTFWPHLFHLVPSVDFYRDLAHVDLRRDVPVHQPPGNQREHCRSRAVNDSKRARRAEVVPSDCRLARSRLGERRIKPRPCSRTGLVRNSSAPTFLALTVTGISAWPVMKLIGMAIFAAANSLWESRPLNPAAGGSRIRRLSTSGRLLLETRWGERNASTRRSSERLTSCAVKGAHG